MVEKRRHVATVPPSLAGRTTDEMLVNSKYELLLDDQNMHGTITNLRE
jgi:hypothetical protein